MDLRLNLRTVLVSLRVDSTDKWVHWRESKEINRKIVIPLKVGSFPRRRAGSSVPHKEVAFKAGVDGGAGCPEDGKPCV